MPFVDAEGNCSECCANIVDGGLCKPDCSGARRMRAMPAQVITHPLVLGPVLKASVEAAERGELPVQKRKAAEREARIETLRDRAADLGLKIGALVSRCGEVSLNPHGGWGRDLAKIHDELKALGAEEE